MRCVVATCSPFCGCSFHAAIFTAAAAVAVEDVPADRHQSRFRRPLQAGAGGACRQIEILARATPKRDYYCQSWRGNRLFELGLSDVGLALCAASSKSDQALIAGICAVHGRDGFLAAWLKAHGLDWAADLIPDLTNLAIDAEGASPASGVVEDTEPALKEEEITS